MGTSRIMRGMTWLVVAAIVLSAASPVWAASSGANTREDIAPLYVTKGSERGETSEASVAARQWIAATEQSTATLMLTTTEVVTPNVVLQTSDASTGVADVAPPLLTLSAEPVQATPGEVITYSVAITNTADVALPHVVLSDTLPAGLVYVAQSAVGFDYSLRDNRLTWDVPQMAPGQALRGGFQARVTALALGELITNTVSATSEATPVVTASALVEVAPPRQNRVWATPGEGGWLRSEDRRVDLRVPRGAVGVRTELRYGAQAGLPELPPHIFFAFALDAVDEQGQAVHEFAAPLTLSAFFDPRQVPPGMLAQLSLFYFNEASGEWEAMPSRVDRHWRRVVASVEHFSTYGLGTDAIDDPPRYEFDPGPMVRGAQPQLYSGSIGYSYQFDLPPGRGGLTPQLGLTYSSSRHRRDMGHYSLVGHGWDILGENYVANDPSEPGLVTLVLNGATYTVDSDKWVVKEDLFLRVEATYGLGLNDPDTYAGIKLRTRDGTLYHFQSYRDVNGSAFLAGNPPMVDKWDGIECDGRLHPDWVRLPLVQVLDPSGNEIRYSWAAATSLESGRHGASDANDDGTGCNYVRTIRLTEIRYNGGNVIVQLQYDDPINNPSQGRWDRPDFYDLQGVRLFPIHKLTGVVVKAGGNTVRQYTLVHAPQGTGSVSQTTLELQQVQETTTSPARSVSFIYEPIPMANLCTYSFLNSVTGPLGGAVIFTATLHGSACENPQPPSVGTRTETDGVTGQSQTWNYAFSGWNTDAHGYSLSKVLLPNTNNGVSGARLLEEHSFLTMTTVDVGGTPVSLDHLAGRESQVSTCPATLVTAACSDSNELTRVHTEWQHTTANLPLPWPSVQDPIELEKRKPRFVYVRWVETYQKNLPLKRTWYDYEPNRQGPSGNTTNYGNVTLVKEFERDPAANSTTFATTPLRSTYTWYYPNFATNAWIINKSAHREFYKVCEGCTNARLVSQMNVYYDQDGPPNRPWAYTYPPTKGWLRRQEGGLDSAWEDTRFTYWANGNLRATERWQGGQARTSSETFYDSTFQAYPVCQVSTMAGWDWNKTVWRYYGVPGSGDPEPTVASVCDNTPAGSALTANGAFFGQVEEERDPNYSATNNTAVSYQYDGWGRLAKVIRPGDDATNPTVQYAYQEYVAAVGTTAVKPFRVNQQRRDNTPGAGASYLNTWTFYDGLGRVIQTQAEAAGSTQVIVASTQYNAQDQTVKQNVPYFSTNTTYPPLALASGDYRTSPDWSRAQTVDTVYDELGRVTQVTNTDDSKVRSAYRYQASDPYPKTAVLDPLNHQTVRETDGLGRLRSARQYMGTYATANFDAAVYAQSRYGYDVADRLEDVWDPDNNNTHMIYDGLGRKTSLVDPDMGTWTYGYDELSNLAWQRDANAKTLCFYYDALSRLRGKHLLTAASCPTWSSNPALLARNYYDTDETGAAVANGLGRRTVMVDTSGNSKWLYDARGRVTRETKVVDGTGGGTFVTQWSSYDAMDRVRTMLYPDNEGVTFTYSSQGPIKTVYGSSTYYVGDTLYNALGQVTDRYLGSTTGVIRQKYTYSAGENFRLTALQSGVSPGYTNLQNITYAYDDAGNALTIADAAAYGGSQTQTFSYDALNRLLTAQATGGSNGAYGQRSYQYSAVGNITNFEGTAFYYQDAAHKHAVTHVGGTAAGNQKYWYDPNGNAWRRINGSSDINLTYDAENRLTGMSGSVTASYVYDGDGNRVKATVGGVTTVYIGNIYERDNGTTVRKYYYAGGVRVATRTGGQTYYLLADHLTSTAITTNSAGARLTELRYYPYGAARYNPGSQLTTYRFTSQRWDSGTALYFYGARWYDPYIGRFLSADTIVPNPGDPQALNRYSYVGNRPTTYVDPSGHAFASPEGGASGAIALAVGYALGSQAGQALNVAVAEAQAFVQSLGLQLGNLFPAVTDQFVNPGQASSSAPSNASGHYDSSQFNFDPGQFDPNKNRPQDVGQEAHRQFRQQFRERMAQQGREEGTGDYLTERGIRDAQGNVVRNAQGQYGKPDAVDYVNHIIYDLKPWQEGGERAILLEYQSQFDLYIKLYELAYGVTPTIRIITYAGP